MVVQRAGRDLDPSELGSAVLVVAPHPDDESLGCGGLIAALRERGVAVDVVIVTDGSGSHPNSSAYTPGRLAELRRREAIAALAILGVAEGRVSWCSLRDRFVPTEGSAGFEAALAQARDLLWRVRPETLVIPSAKDAHGDHQATALIWRRVIRDASDRPRVLEYIVWPAADRETRSGRALRLDICAVLPVKCRAIAAHRSQLGLVVTDDPTGFVVPEGLLRRAARPFETFFEAMI
jgi:LmbE family N-acetylglucosaminyl deacetylase